MPLSKRSYCNPKSKPLTNQISKESKFQLSAENSVILILEISKVTFPSNMKAKSKNYQG